MTNFEWLAALKPNAIHLGRNDEFACNYVTAAKWIEEDFFGGEFEECTPEELQIMRDTNTIWTLQIYPSTPVGFYKWVAPTMDAVIAKAREQWPSIAREYDDVHDPDAN